MYEDDSTPPKSRFGILPTIVFVLGVGLVAGSAFTMATTSTNEGNDQVLVETETGPDSDLFSQLNDYLSTIFEKPKPRWEMDQAALPKTPEGWDLVVGLGGGQTHALAKHVYNAMHRPKGPLNAQMLAAFGAAQKPNGLMSEALTNARNSMNAVGVSETEAKAQTAVSPLFVKFGDSIARKVDKTDQSRVYIVGDDVVMVMVRRLPRSYKSKGSWLHKRSQNKPVPVTLAGHTFLESANTAKSDDIHALRLDITSHLFIEIGGRVDRKVLEEFVENIDFASLQIS